MLARDATDGDRSIRIWCRELVVLYSLARNCRGRKLSNTAMSALRKKQRNGSQGGSRQRSFGNFLASNSRIRKVGSHSVCWRFLTINHTTIAAKVQPSARLVI